MNVTAILKSKGRNVVTATAATTLEEIARRLAEHKIGAIVVSDGGKVLGIISERDIIKAIAVRGVACMLEPVAGSMTRAVQTCDSDDTLDELMAKMTAGRFRHLPVVEKGKLAGMISIGDVVKHHVAEVEMEASALRQYIVAG
jgi:CBS domain-containing protein